MKSSILSRLWKAQKVSQASKFPKILSADGVFRQGYYVLLALEPRAGSDYRGD